jgi:hypothetical protein
MIEIKPESVVAVTLADGTVHYTRGLRQVELGGLFEPGTRGLEGKTEAGFLYAPLTELRSVVTLRRVMTTDEIANERAQADAEAARLFEWQHRTDPNTYASAASKQKGKCVCGKLLEQKPITHYHESQRKVLCRACSPFEHRYGSPS